MPYVALVGTFTFFLQQRGMMWINIWKSLCKGDSEAFLVEVRVDMFKDGAITKAAPKWMSLWYTNTDDVSSLLL
jgi:hypothetical protein